MVCSTVVLAGAPTLRAHADTSAQLDTTTSTSSTTISATPAPVDDADVVADDFVLPQGFAWLVDDTERITVAVPESWTDVETTPLFVGGVEVPSIHAATDRDVWRDTFDAPGVWFAAFPFAPDPQTVYDRYALTSGCADREIAAYSDGAYFGTWWKFTSCGSTHFAEWHAIVASPASQDFTALVVMQMADAGDIHAFSVVRDTFNMTPTATWPTTASTEPTRPTTTDG